jgi:hypothetical protein
LGIGKTGSDCVSLARFFDSRLVLRFLLLLIVAVFDMATAASCASFHAASGTSFKVLVAPSIVFILGWGE